MNLKFLGTGAADFSPILDTDDKLTVDKNIRRCSSTLLDGKVLIDCGPHVLDALDLFSADKSKIEHLLLTHDHSDHCDVSCITEIAKRHPLHIWHSGEWSLPEIDGVTYHNISVGGEYEIGDFCVTPLTANHCKGSLHYSIEKSGKKLFYGLDGAWLLTDTYYYMMKKSYDLMILDATVGDYEGDYRMAEHNSIPMIRMMEKSFRKVEISSDKTKIVLDHLARTLHKPHTEVCEQVKDDGYIVAYDGMEITI